MPRRQWRQARPPDETDSTTRKKRAQRRRERARAQELEGNDESNGWAPTTKETKKPKKPKGEPRAQPMKQVPIHASARRGRAEEAEGAEGAEGDAESHYTMADSVCAGGTVERTRRTARPRTAGTACSSWPEGVPRDFSLEASKVFIESTRNGVFWDACWSWLGARPRTALWQTGGNGTHAVRSAVGRAVGRTAGQDCGTGGRPTGYSLCKGSIPLGGSPRLLSVARALLPKRVFYLEGGGRKPGQWERARARVRQTWGFFMDVYSGEVYGRRVRALQGETSLQVFR